MQSNYQPPELKTRRNILEIVTGYTQLRKSGRESLGLCPLHGEKTPSFRVNEDKGVFHCFGCGAGGDVIRFVQLVEGVDFKGALSLLRMGDDPPPPPEVRQAAKRLTKWIKDQIEKMNLRLRLLDEQLDLADEIPDPELAEAIWNERRILADVRDDLSRAEYRPDFVEIEHIIEGITKGFE